MRRRRNSPANRLVVEALECRVLLSADDGFHAEQARARLAGVRVTPAVEVRGLSERATSPVGLTPAQIRGAYGLGPFGASPITFKGIQGDGAGQTVAIIVAYHHPNALADLQTFSARFGLPAPNLTVVNQQGNPSPLPGVEPDNNPFDELRSVWSLEASLDLQAIHAIAPRANLVLVECNSVQASDVLSDGVAAARNLPGVSVVSMSLGTEELDYYNSLDGDYTTPLGHTGVTFVVATGDTGGVNTWPAISQNVVGVGGTTLNVSGNSYVSEAGWGGSGGGIAKYHYQPQFQSAAFASPQRTNPDVSALADPETGLAMLDTYNFPTSPWIQVAGTSLATPVWAGMLAIANQGRVISGLTTLDGASQTLPLLYGLPANHFHDVTTGNTTFAAGPGYDLVTGRGSPVGNLLIPALASAAAPMPRADLEPVIPDGGWSAPLVLSTTPDVFTDPAMIVPGQTGYLNAGRVNPGAIGPTPPFTMNYRFNGFDLAPFFGNPTSTGLNVNGISSDTNLNVGVMPNAVVELKQIIDVTNAIAENTETDNIYIRTYFIDNSANTNFVVRGAGANLQVLRNGQLVYAPLKSAIHGYCFYLSGSGQNLTIDLSNGDPLPQQGIVANSTGGTLTITGSAGADEIFLEPTQLRLGSQDVPSKHAGWTAITVNGGGGTDTLYLGGTSGNDSASINASQLNLNGRPITYGALEQLSVFLGDGNDTLTQTAQPGTTLTFDADPPDTLNVNAGFFAFAPGATFGGGPSVNVASGAGLLLEGDQHLRSLQLNGGIATTAANGAAVLILNAISASGGGRLNLSNNALIVDYTGPSPLAAVRNLLVSGRSGGTWNGNGINSSAAAIMVGTALGYGESAAILGVGGGSFAGQNVDGSAVLIRYTRLGDTDLDRDVDLSDLGNMASSFGVASGKFWNNGDLDFDGDVDLNDLGSLATYFSTTFAVAKAQTPAVTLSAPMASGQRGIVSRRQAFMAGLGGPLISDHSSRNDQDFLVAPRPNLKLISTTPT
jgi:hypothetical protein